MLPNGTYKNGISHRPPLAVYCGSNHGKYLAFSRAANSMGCALAGANRPLVYGGGSSGLMGVVSAAALECGGSVVGVIPRAMITKGGEGEKLNPREGKAGQDKLETIVVDSMHERKVEMAKRVEGFIGLPGGYGTFEEVLEVTTWAQLGIHDKPVVLLNVLSFWEPLRTLIRTSIDAGFIRSISEQLIIFVDGPDDPQEHEAYDWGKAALEALDTWERGKNNPLFDWHKKPDSREDVSYGET